MIMLNELQLREALTQAAAWIREQMRRADMGNNFRLTVELDGPVQAEDIRLKYTVKSLKNYEEVCGNSVNETTMELLRRSGWQIANNGVRLTYQPAAPEAS